MIVLSLPNSPNLQRIQHAMHILNKFILPLPRLALIQPHTVVHEFRAVGGTLIVLPDRDGFVDTFDGDGVDDVFLSRTFLHLDR